VARGRRRQPRAAGRARDSIPRTRPARRPASLGRIDAGCRAAGAASGRLCGDEDPGPVRDRSGGSRAPEEAPGWVSRPGRSSDCLSAPRAAPRPARLSGTADSRKDGGSRGPDLFVGPRPGAIALGRRRGFADPRGLSACPTAGPLRRVLGRRRSAADRTPSTCWSAPTTSRFLQPARAVPGGAAGARGGRLQRAAGAVRVLGPLGVPPAVGRAPAVPLADGPGALDERGDGVQGIQRQPARTTLMAVPRGRVRCGPRSGVSAGRSSRRSGRRRFRAVVGPGATPSWRLEWLFWSGRVTAARPARLSSACTTWGPGRVPAGRRAGPRPTPREGPTPTASCCRGRRRPPAPRRRDGGANLTRLLPAAGGGEMGARVPELVEGTGELRRVTVGGAGGKPGYLHRGRRPPCRGRCWRARPAPRRSTSLVWAREPEPERLCVRECCVPAGDLRGPPGQAGWHGYYVLPFLLGDELVARVDLRADRRRPRGCGPRRRGSRTATAPGPVGGRPGPASVRSDGGVAGAGTASRPTDRGGPWRPTWRRALG